MTDPKYLIKCSCEECNCPSATVDGVCFECIRGLHVTHYQDGEVKRAQARALCPDCGLYPCDCARDL